MRVYLTKDNILYNLDGTLIANNVREVYKNSEDITFLTLNSVLYDYTGTEIDTNVKKGIFDTDYYIKNDGKLFYFSHYDGSKRQSADDVKDVFYASKNGLYYELYYVTNDDKTYNVHSKEEENRDELKYIKRRSTETSIQRYEEFEDGKIMYRYYVDGDSNPK